ncbi:MAG: hypothetical protein GXO91_10540, partial [FCB group bacterium]|nr:hypothetical protein [FCB group bacterium]
ADIRLLCLHQAIEGCRVRHYTFRNGPDVIRGGDIPDGFQAILSGHIHRAQILYFSPPGGEQVPVIYCGSVERTSFAEKDEIKGFYFLDFRLSQNRQWELTEPRFNPLPTRPMLDLPLDVNDLTRSNYRRRMQKIVTSAHPDAIIRLIPEAAPASWLIQSLTAEFLRAIALPTQNISLHSKFFNNSRTLRRRLEKKPSGQTRLEVF